MPPTLDLSRATPDQINAAVAEHVEGYQRFTFCRDDVYLAPPRLADMWKAHPGLGWKPTDSPKAPRRFRETFSDHEHDEWPDYLGDARTILPLLRGYASWSCSCDAHHAPSTIVTHRVTVSTGSATYTREDQSFHRAAAMVMLLAAGVQLI